MKDLKLEIDVDSVPRTRDMCVDLHQFRALMEDAARDLGAKVGQIVHAEFSVEVRTGRMRVVPGSERIIKR